MELLQRTRLLNNSKEKAGPIVYWMTRDQRVHDNYSLLFAQELALKRGQNLYIVFNLLDDLGTSDRQFNFMLRGLEILRKELKNYNIPFFLLSGSSEAEIPKFLKETNAGILVTDFDPIRIKKAQKGRIAEKIKIQLYEADAHNIIPCWIASGKLEYGAYTIRPKINRLLPSYLEEYPRLKMMPDSNFIKDTSHNKILTGDLIEKKAFRPASGETAAINALNDFLENKIDRYSTDKNDPNKDCLSGLSPYLHFGHISSQRIALNTEKSNYNTASKEAFLEELIVRKELSDNFCNYNANYDSFEGFPNWAKESLNQHRKDEREYVYTLKEFEKGKTHEGLWNAAQWEMVNTGKMHSYMRMYWAKKILEWSASPEDALKTVLYLNDKYELDGRDPNGYAGCAWSIGGVHDRSWFERQVFGKIRYMNLKGAERKFDIDNYIQSNKATKTI
jgi:deoxyribodipyrimidine photo-lyase